MNSGLSRAGFRLAAVVAVGALFAGMAPAVADPYPRPGANTRLDRYPNGGKPPACKLTDLYCETGQSIGTSISEDGRYVAFDTDAGLVPQDDNHRVDVYLRDMKTNRLWYVSRGMGGIYGTASNDPVPILGDKYGRWGDPVAWDPAISGNGRYVAYTSIASNHVPGDTNLALDVFLFDRVKQTTKRVSISSKGDQSSFQADDGDVALTPASRSATVDYAGRYVAFESVANNFAPGDKNHALDVFVHDTLKGTTRRVSRPLNNVDRPSCLIDGGLIQAACIDVHSRHPSISANGRYVAFESASPALVPNDTNTESDVFVHDIKKNKNELVSLTWDNKPAEDTSAPSNQIGGSRLGGINVASAQHSISADGRYVVFYSDSDNMVPSDRTGQDVYVRDRKLKRTERVMVSSAGQEFPLSFTWIAPVISRDGRFVGFTGYLDGSPEAPPDSPSGTTIYVHDRVLGSTEMTTRTASGKLGTGCGVSGPSGYRYSDVREPDLSATGRYVTFHTCNTTMHGGDKNKPDQIHALYRDRGPVTGLAGVRANRRGSGVTVTGRATFSGNVVLQPKDGARDGMGIARDMGGEIVGGKLSYRTESEDLYLRLNLASIPSQIATIGGVTTAGDPRTLYIIKLTVNGAPYEIRAHSAGIGSLSRPVEPAYGLFRCSETLCEEVMPLKGGYGTIGPSITVSLPLKALRSAGTKVREGGFISEIRALTVIGTYLTGPGPSPVILDQMRWTKAARIEIPRKRVSVIVGETKKAGSLDQGAMRSGFPRRLFSSSSKTPVRIRTCVGARCEVQTFRLRP